MRTVRSWWWIPVVALLGLVLKAVLLTPWVAGKAEDAAVGALAAAGLDAVGFVEVSGVDGIGADGLNVVLRGPAADEAAAVATVEALDEVDTVAYRVVDGAGGDGAAATDTATAQAEVADPDPPSGPAPTAVALNASADGSVTLDGVVADEATRAALVTAAESEYGSGNVVDRLRVDAAGITDEGGVVTLAGAAESDDQRAQWLGQGAAVAEAAGLTVADELSVRPVEETLNQLFQLEPIEFDSSRSTIRDESIPTLDRAAELINANPGAGRLRVIGHTDSDGARADNQRLSEDRAAAVVTYLVETGGVAPDRLESQGRGEIELLVDPDPSPEDKQRNRRVEWELISP